VKRKSADKLIFSQSKNLHKILIIGIVSLLFLLNRRLLVLGIITFIAAIIGYYHDKINKTVFDFRLSFILGIIITRYYGLFYTLVFFVLSNILPNLLAGGRIDGPSMIFHLEYFALFASVLLFPNTDLLLLGLILVAIDALLGIFINGTLGVPWFLAVMAGTVAFIMRTIYFLTIGSFLEIVLGLI
jgi:hypothetical protein